MRWPGSGSISCAHVGRGQVPAYIEPLDGNDTHDGYGGRAQTRRRRQEWAKTSRSIIERRGVGTSERATLESLFALMSSSGS